MELTAKLSLIWICCGIFCSKTILAQENEACRSVEDCPAIKKLFDTGGFFTIKDFKTCGLDAENNPKFICPSLTKCNCLPVRQCPPFQALISMRKFQTLRSFEDCGFANNAPKYCCPMPQETIEEIKNSTEEPENQEFIDFVTPRIDTEEEESREDFFENLEESCGVATTTNIFGGEAVGAHDHPWAAALVYETEDESSRLYLCGGVLVSRNVIITAAHCNNSLLGHSLKKARLGHANITSPWAFDAKIEKVVLHPEFGQDENKVLFNDIAAIKLAEPLELIPAVKPVCLPSANLTELRLRDDLSEVVGWGANENGSNSDVLLKVNLETLLPEDCQREIQAFVSSFNLRQSQICARGIPGEDSCRGDSGGPLLFFDNDIDRMIVTGLVSFGHPNCDSTIPGVYTKVSHYVDWIENFIYDNRPEN